MAVLSEDVRIRVAYGLGSGLNSAELPFQFPDPSVSFEWSDVHFNGALVDRVPMISVDGGRGVLPHPVLRFAHREQMEPGDPTKWVVTSWERDFARVTHQLNGGSIDDFESFFERSTFVVED